MAKLQDSLSDGEIVLFFGFPLATGSGTVTITLVPLGGGFGDWATPKASATGLFLRAELLSFLQPLLATLPLLSAPLPGPCPEEARARHLHETRNERCSLCEARVPTRG